jgi:hypothetical protein
MLAKALLPLLWPLAAAVVQYLKAKHRWTWQPVSILWPSEEADPYFEKSGRRIALDAILGSVQMTFFIYLAAWSPELFKLWRVYPTLTVLAVLFVAGLLDISRRRQTPIQN